MLKLMRKNQKGFTLIEVMLVVLIIGIIAVIALPKLLVTINQARNKSCLSNQQAIRTAIEQNWWEEGAYPEATTVAELITELETEGHLPATSTVSATCPGGGTYTYTAADGSFVCSIHLDLTTDVAPPAP